MSRPVWRSRRQYFAALLELANLFLEIQKYDGDLDFQLSLPIMRETTLTRHEP